MDINIVSADEALTFAQDGPPTIEKAGREAKPLPEELVTISEGLNEGQYVPVVQGYPKAEGNSDEAKSHNSKIVAQVNAWNTAARREGRSLLFVLRSSKDEAGDSFYSVWMGNDPTTIEERLARIEERKNADNTEE